MAWNPCMESQDCLPQKQRKTLKPQNRPGIFFCSFRVPLEDPCKGVYESEAHLRDVEHASRWRPLALVVGPHEGGHALRAGVLTVRRQLARGGRQQCGAGGVTEDDQRPQGAAGGVHVLLPGLRQRCRQRLKGSGRRSAHRTVNSPCPPMNSTRRVARV
eukprot:1192630-Prorocentrum_minimum.AAC.1